MIESENSFLNDSSQLLKKARLGYFFGLLIKWLLVFLVTVLLVGMGQFAQYNNSYNDYQQKAISAWVGGNQERQAIATGYINNCVKSKMSKNTNELPLKAPITLSDCAKQIDASELLISIEGNNVLHSLAWPLSLLD